MKWSVDVELIEEPERAAVERPQHRPSVWRTRVGWSVAVLVAAFLGHYLGAESPPTAGSANAETASEASQDVETRLGIFETSQGLLVSLDDSILGTPATEGAKTIREASELWAADITSNLSEAERELLRDPPGPLAITADARTGRYISVTISDTSADD